MHAIILCNSVVLVFGEPGLKEATLQPCQAGTYPTSFPPFHQPALSSWLVDTLSQHCLTQENGADLWRTWLGRGRGQRCSPDTLPFN